MNQTDYTRTPNPNSGICAGGSPTLAPGGWAITLDEGELDQGNDFGNVQFQPSVTIDKTGDALSKIGDDVTYTITVENTSSAPTPSLVCTVSDSTLNFSKNVTLAPGATDVSNVPFTIPADAADPYPNTASVSCAYPSNPTAEVASDSDGHSINLFQPAIELSKAGEASSKIGDSVDYTITLVNNSSADTPDLVCTVTDTLVGVDETS